MTTRPCPHCQTGWRYAEDMPLTVREPSASGLVPCPTCGGTGHLSGIKQAKVAEAPLPRAA